MEKMEMEMRPDKEDDMQRENTIFMKGAEVL
jgi:hypothetical protein